MTGRIESLRSPTPRIFFVDDEPQVCKAVKRTLERLPAQITCFSNAADCLQALQNESCDLLISDVNMPEMDGMALLDEVKRIWPALPVLIVTGYGDIPLAIRAVKAGAEEFIEKPLDKPKLLKVVSSMLRRSLPDRKSINRALTETETKVLRFILQGRSNREIAQTMHRSIRTVEDHRNRIMAKLGVHNVVDLVKKAMPMMRSD